MFSSPSSATRRSIRSFSVPFPAATIATPPSPASRSATAASTSWSIPFVTPIAPA